MLGWTGFIGGLLEFMIKRLLGRTMDLALNDSRRACSAFWHLHTSVAKLHRDTASFVAALGRVADGSQSRLYTREIRRAVTEIEGHSREFLDVARELIDALSIYDKKLATFVGGVAAMKRGVIKHGLFTALSSSMEFELDWGPADPVRPLRKITYSEPDRQVDSAEFQAAFDQYLSTLHPVSGLALLAICVKTHGTISR